MLCIQIGYTLTVSGDQRGKGESCDDRRDYNWTGIAELGPGL